VGLFVCLEARLAHLPALCSRPLAVYHKRTRPIDFKKSSIDFKESSIDFK